MRFKIFILPMMAFIALLFNLSQPLHSTKNNLYILAMIGVIVVSLVWLTVGKKKLMIFVLSIFILPWLPIINQSKVDVTQIKKYYLEYLSNYEGTKYVWGGEGYYGIDCSGLPRSALIKAYFSYAYFNFNGKALRKGIWLWWFDASAKEILNGYKGQTIVDRKLYKIIDLRKDLEPGDMATNGSHVMVYLSESEIIQSDPDRNRVVIDKLPGKSHWYRMDVNLVKWNWEK